MKTIDPAAVAGQPGLRLQFLMDFTGYGAAEAQALKDSVPLLAPKIPAVLDAVYDHLLSFDDTRKVFLGARGTVDPAYIAIRKEHLTEWVLRTIESSDPERLSQYLMETGRRHTGVAGEPQRVVAPRYIVATMSVVQTAIWSTLFEALPDRPADVERMGLAWNKMLMMQLEVLLKAIAPQWPRWDEPPLPGSA